ncbi:hypothetical protein DFH09DRAFT_1171903 [Mycena vulgaris]|nr:hypothetical protein DFH09DRAFT_1171903 [Mycena vulgaris]
MSSLRAMATRGGWRPLGSLSTLFCNARYYAVKPIPGAATKWPGRPRVTVDTLDLSRIQSTDYLDLSHRGKVSIRFAHNERSSSVGMLSYGYYRDDKTWRFPFPNEACGFLYYHFDPRGPPLKGGLRFRSTADKSPSSFPRGRDLVGPSGAVWEISLEQIACRRVYGLFTEQLVRENLVTQEQLSRCRSLFSPRNSISPHYILFRLDSTFRLKFSSAVGLTVAGEGLHKLDLRHLCSETIQKVLVYPWTGSAMARFEPSKLPEHAGRRVLHVRIVEILQPVECAVPGYDGRVVRPEEGQLVMVRNHGGPPRPWAYDIDDSTLVGGALRVLWDNSQTPNVDTAETLSAVVSSP